MTRLAYSLEQLRSEFNAAFPNRDKASDGTIGDAAHAATRSDHNPNAAGVICAMDIDTDLDGTDDSNDAQMDAIVEYIRLHPHPDLKYVIYRGRMFSSYARAPYAPFEWRPYTGDSHVSHPHFSVGVGPDGRSVQPYDDRDPWGIVAPQPHQPQEDPEVARLNYMKSESDAQVYLAGLGFDPMPISSFADAEYVAAVQGHVIVPAPSGSPNIEDAYGQTRAVWTLGNGAKGRHAAKMMRLPGAS